MSPKAYRVIPGDGNYWIVQCWMRHFGGFWQDTFITPSLTHAFAHITLQTGGR